MQFFTIRQYILFAQNFCVSYLFERTLQSLSSKSQCPLPPSSSKLRCTYIAWRSSKASAWNRVPFQRTSEQRQQKCNELKKKFFFFAQKQRRVLENINSYVSCYKVYCYQAQKSFWTLHQFQGILIGIFFINFLKINKVVSAEKFQFLGIFQ